ncbi:hypothetical protein P4S93_12375 [Aneurinibacillus thermoaerophilus]|nr:hypothetical protein [Aneurinibacillus sp. XH2]MED0736578.1 hypothetical protein [Aneurinibacillus thermoaerophilus]MED0761560.1 hypothetical protein [Aneurinibacillus thermoaerophilus]MED0764429.1 hypothetical protein [Aneurinibacillus thermoaerophilus]
MGDVHEGALLVPKENKTVEIDERAVTFFGRTRKI